MKIFCDLRRAASLASGITVVPLADVERGVLLAGPDAIFAISSGGRLAFSVTEEKIYVEVLWGERY